MKLYGYFRSSAAFRVRIGLNLKNIPYEREYIHLRKGDQRSPDYAKLNPQQLVPTLVDGDLVLTQSLAILEYLDEIHPTPALLPPDPKGRARVRALAGILACDVHPIDNLRVLKYLTAEIGVDDAALGRWFNHWIIEGFDAFEAMLAGSPSTGCFCHGDMPTIADICLVPQIANSQRYKLDLKPYPIIRRIHEACMAVPAFADAHPSKQPDFEP